MGSRASSKGWFSPNPLVIPGIAITAILVFCFYTMLHAAYVQVHDPSLVTKVVNDTGKVLDWDCAAGPLRSVAPGSVGVLHLMDDTSGSLDCDAKEERGLKFCPALKPLRDGAEFRASALLRQQNC